MENKLAYTKISDKSFDEIVTALEENSAANMFRVLHIHDVQGTLKEKGFERPPFKIIEVCNSGFAHEALGKDLDVGLFMPCKFTVAEVNGKTRVTLARPSVISQMLPDANLEEMAETVEATLKKVMEESL